MIRNWNEGWLFYRGDDAPVPVCLPHDAMLLEPRDAKCRNGVNSGYFPGGKYTYEKHFQVSPEDLGQFIAVRFDGVYQNCTVSVNAKRVGNHFYGFTPFEVDISQAVHVAELPLVHRFRHLPPGAARHCTEGACSVGAHRYVKL